MKEEIISQYKASLKMLKNTIEKCPENAWNNDEYDSAYWRLVYHALYFSALYLSENPEKFTPWRGHRDDYEDLGSVIRDNKPVVFDKVFTKEEMLEYAESIMVKSENAVRETSADEKSGFNWLPMSRIGVHLYNIRHLQHHTGQLTERLHRMGITGIRWEKQG